MNILNKIDHTALKPTVTKNQIEKLCNECMEFGFRGVCVPPTWVKECVKLITNDYKISTVIGFPLGYNSKTIKMAEAADAINNGANELDVVWDINAFLNKEYLKVQLELSEIVKLAGDIKIKVIVEECYLNLEQKILAYQIIQDSGAWCIKTSTGFGPGGATIVTVKNWADSGNLKIKAAGGIKTLVQATNFIYVGANILGTSSGVAIAKELENE